MKLVSLAVGLVILAAALFIGGAAATQIGLSFAGFCLWTPSIFLLGYAVRGMPKRLALVDSDDKPSVQARSNTQTVRQRQPEF